RQQPREHVAQHVGGTGVVGHMTIIRQTDPKTALIYRRVLTAVQRVTPEMGTVSKTCKPWQSTQLASTKTCETWLSAPIVMVRRFVASSSRLRPPTAARITPGRQGQKRSLSGNRVIWSAR
ncbi:MAG: hypothetical protein LBK95_12090, partial [Bifidobacteriaceae bacterium]|nr:hypothetical protein [Bifidobacteriaceae bacterium]